MIYWFIYSEVTVVTLKSQNIYILHIKVTRPEISYSPAFSGLQLSFSLLQGQIAYGAKTKMRTLLAPLVTLVRSMNLTSESFLF